MKIPIIKKGEYDIWSMRMRQYICHTDHNLWDIIVDGDLQEEAAPAGNNLCPPAPLRLPKQITAQKESGKSCNQIKVYGDEMKRSLSSTSNSQNLAFLSFENTSSLYEVSTTSGNFGVNTARGTNSSSQVSSTLGADEVIDQDDLEELDIRWQVAMKGALAKGMQIKDGTNGKGSFGDNWPKQRGGMQQQILKPSSYSTGSSMMVRSFDLER
ncbi:hypothetical protein Tco_1225908 [Tanacetum coccineum]